MAEWSWPGGDQYSETPPTEGRSYEEYRTELARRTDALLSREERHSLRAGGPDSPDDLGTATKEVAKTSSGVPAVPDFEVPKPDGWWFCDPPTLEEIRFRIDRETGRPIAAYLSCPHGTWTDLRSARAAHSIEV